MLLLRVSVIPAHGLAIAEQSLANTNDNALHGVAVCAGPGYVAKHVD